MCGRYGGLANKGVACFIPYISSLLVCSLVSFVVTYIGWLAGHGWIGWDLDWSGYEGFGMEI